MSESAAIWISLLALAVSAFSLGWNVYRDVVLKPRMKVAISVSAFLRHPATDEVIGIRSLASNSEDISKERRFIHLTGTNLGPGQITCNAVIFYCDSFLMRVLGRASPTCVFPDSRAAGFDGVPTKLDVGDEIKLAYAYNKDAFLRRKPKCVGIQDTYGKIHWTSRKSLRKCLRIFSADHG